MKSIVCLSVCGLALLAVATIAQGGGPASNGDFQFAVEGAAGAIQFDARTHGATSSGHVQVTLDTDVSNADPDGTGGGTPVSRVELAAEFDCLLIAGNRAAMSGRIVSSTVEDYLDRQAVLVVEDNGEGNKAPALDMFTWGVYPTTALRWVPSDAELEFDPGSGTSWVATDAEREDDAGLPMSFSIPSPVTDCTSFPLSSYALVEIAHVGGNVQVKP